MLDDKNITTSAATQPFTQRPKPSMNLHKTESTIVKTREAVPIAPEKYSHLKNVSSFFLE